MLKKSKIFSFIKAPPFLNFSSSSPDKSEGDINISPHRQQWQESLPSRTKDILLEDSKYFLHQSLSTPCLNVLKSCKGSSLTDIENNKILDFHGNSVHQVGFSNKHVIKAIKVQMKKLSFCTRRYTNKPAIKLAKTLVKSTNSELPRVLFCPGGTSAIGIALKLARISTGRYKTISLWDSFHGASLDAISIGGEAIFRKGIGPLLPGCEHAPPCDPYRCVYGCGGSCSLKCADYVEYIMEKEKDIAAFIAEPIRWTPYTPPIEYWKRIRQICDKYGAKLIFDEIPNSLGRTGVSLFTYKMFDIIPDILVIGKGLGGGILPLAAVLCKEDFNEKAKEIALGHYTHEKNPVLCAAGLATLKYIKSHNLVEKAKEKGGYIKEVLLEMKEKYKFIGDVRGQGLLIGIELIDDIEKKSRGNEKAEKIMYLCLKKGLSFKLTMGNIITLCPPLNIKMKEIDKALGILKEAFEEIHEEDKKK